jgi:AcrR family transcriptional regulator
MGRPANPRLANDILRVTADIVEEKGPENVTLREVADRLRYTATTIYLYYKNKDELLQATVDRSFEWFAEAQDAAEDRQAPAEALRRRVLSYVDWGIEHPGVYRLMFQHPAEAPTDPVRIALRRRWLERDHELLQQVLAAVPEQYRPPLDVVDNGIWGTAHGLVSLIISGRMFGPLGRAIGVDEAKARAQRVLEGILALPVDQTAE